MGDQIGGPVENTDVELWREPHPDGDDYSYYSPSISVTKGGALCINVGGIVFAKTLRGWHALALAAAQEKTAAQSTVTQEQTTAKPL